MSVKFSITLEDQKDGTVAVDLVSDAQVATTQELHVWRAMIQCLVNNRFISPENLDEQNIKGN